MLKHKRDLGIEWSIADQEDHALGLGHFALVFQLLERFVSDSDKLNVRLHYCARNGIYLNNQLRGKRRSRRLVYMDEMHKVPFKCDRAYG